MTEVDGSNQNKGTGDGSVPHVTPLQFWSAIIPLMASSLILPMWQLWLSSQHESNRQHDTNKVLTNQAETHEAVKTVENEQVKTVNALNKVADAVPADKPSADRGQ